ncbi:hypothetical protein A5N14_06440 [Arthrobacter sp. M5]|nr:hypothetical protein [Arthrobacter sp. M5]
MPCTERGRSAFEEVLCELADGGVIQRANSVSYRLTFPTTPFEGDHELSIPKHRDVCVVCAQNDLPLTLKAAKPLHNAAEDKAVV